MPSEEEVTGQLCAMTAAALPEWVERLREETSTDPWLLKKQQQILNKSAQDGFEIKEGLIFFRNRFCLKPTSDLCKLVIEELHGSRGGGHSRVYRTLARIRLRLRESSSYVRFVIRSKYPPRNLAACCNRCRFRWPYGRSSEWIL